MKTLQRIVFFGLAIAAGCVPTAKMSPVIYAAGSSGFQVKLSIAQDSGTYEMWREEPGTPNLFHDSFVLLNVRPMALGHLYSFPIRRGDDSCGVLLLKPINSTLIFASTGGFKAMLGRVPEVVVEDNLTSMLKIAALGAHWPRFNAFDAHVVPVCGPASRKHLGYYAVVGGSNDKA